MGRLEKEFHGNASKNNIELKKDYAEKSSETTGIEIQSQHWDGNRMLLMEGNAVEYFPYSIHPGSNEINLNLIHI